jgi:hypothetical protein
MVQTAFHPRLQARRDTLGQLLELTDPTELAAALDDIQTLLHRCGYHLRYSAFNRALHVARRRGSRAARHSGRGRGRPAGSANWATRQLGLGLATIWAEQCGRAPTRRYDAVGERPARGVPRLDPKGEHGPFRAFVACVMDAMPRRIKATRKGHVPEVDHLVRTAIEEFKAAKESSDEARRRGLLEDARWAG